MAELDDRLLRNLDSILQSMNQRLVDLESTLSGVKSNMSSTFDPSILRDWSNAMNGIKAGRLIDAEGLKDVGEVKTVFNQIKILKEEIERGKRFQMFSPEELEQARQKLAEIQAQIAILNKDLYSGKIADKDIAYLAELRGERSVLNGQIKMGGQFVDTLDEESLRQKKELLAQYKNEKENFLKSEQQRSAELVNLKKREQGAEESAVRSAMANIKQQIDAQVKLQRIEHDREIRKQTGATISKQQIDEEIKQYNALSETIQRLQNDRSRLYDFQRVTSEAWNRMYPYQDYAESKENLRYLKQLQDIEKQQKKNTDETKKQDKALRDVEMTAQRLKSALVAAFGIQQIKTFLSNVVKIRGEFEMTEVALTNIIGNSEKAQTVWKKTMNLALNSPLTAQQLTKYTKQLAAFRIETGKLYDTTKMLGDVAVGLGVDMERLILAYGHTRSSGFLRGMYARQFATAGVNIYGELADYYSQIENKVVTFKDVYERISKKLVTFADVEKVFEKITSKGGTFYNMQEELTNTVQGQINKIKDTWQQTMNAIGKSDQGFIRNITGIVLNIVKNWRIWLRLIESTTAAIIVFKATQFTAALFSINSAAIATSKGMTRLATAFKTLGKSIASNPIGLVLTLLTLVGVELYSLFKNMRDVNKEIDKNNLVLYDARQKLLDYQKRVDENNKTIEEYGKKANKSKEEQEALSKAQSDNARIVSSLKKEYPELVEGLEQEANGYVELTKQIDAHNRSLQEQVGLNALLKQKSLFNESASKDAEDYWDDVQDDVADVVNSIQELRIMLATKGIDQDSILPVLQDIINIDWSNPINGLTEYNRLYEEFYRQRLQERELIADRLLSNDEVNTYSGNYYGRHNAALNQAAKDETFVLKYADAFDLLSDKIGLTTHAYKEFAREFTISEGDDKPSMARRMAYLYVDELKQQVEDLPKGEAKDSFEQWLSEEEGNMAAVVLKHGSEINEWTRQGLITANEAYRQVLVDQGKAVSKDRQNVLNDELRIELAFIAKQTELAEIKAQLAAEEAKKVTKRSKERIDSLRNQVKDLLKGTEDEWDVFIERLTKGGGGGEGDDKNKTYKSLDELLNLLKTMNSEYNKLSKSAYGFAKSNEMVMDVFRESFKDIFKTTQGMNKLDDVLTMINFNSLDITSKQGLAKAFQELYDFLEKNNLWNQFGKDADKLRAKLQKTIDMQEVEVGMDVQIRIREDFGREIEKAFKDYELTIELQKINLPEDVAKDLFGFEYGSLYELLERIRAFRTDLENTIVTDENGNETIENRFSEEDEKVYTNWMKKVEDKLFQMRKESAKEYTKYLEQELSKRAKLEMEYVRDVSYVQANFKDSDQKKAILDNLQKNYEQSLKELQWKSFKESDFYVEMMQDLTSMPSEYLDLMMQKLDEWANKADVLSPRALKEVLKAREKVLEAQVALSPVRALRQSLGVISGFQSDTTRTDEEGNQIKISKGIAASRKQLQGIIADRAKNIILLQDELDEQEKILGTIKAQEEIQEALLQLSNKGVEDITLTSNAETDVTAIDAKIKAQEDLLNSMSTVVKEEGESEESFARRQRQYEDEQKEIKIIIELLQQLRLLREQAKEAGVDPTANLSASKLGTIANVNRLKNEIAAEEKAQAKDQGIMTSGYAAWNKAVHGLIGNISNVTSKVKDLGNQFYDTLEAVGVETDAISDAWVELGNGIFDTITNTLTLLPSLITGFEATGAAVNASMGIIGLIAEAIQLTLMLIKGIAKIHDARFEVEIEKQQKKIDELTRAYDRLEKAIDKTFDTMSYMQDYNEMAQNLYEQIDALNAQINAEQSKKKVDSDKIQDYNDKIQDAEDQLDELKQKQIETFGGIGEEGYKDAAQGFVDAWKSAFLETGDGLSGLQDHFDEFLQEWFTKQATMQVATKMLRPLFKQIDEAVDQYSDQGAIVTGVELDKIKEFAKVLFPQLSENLETLAGIWGLGGEGSLSGLAAGIQGMTEEQANILEAYWNSVRGYTASIDANVATIVGLLSNGAGKGDISGGVNYNPMLQQITLVEQNTKSINALLQSVTRSGHSMGGQGIKVFVN